MQKAKLKIIKRRYAGFTLLEVMLTLSIVSISLITVLRAYVMITQAESSSINHTKAMFLTQRKLSELRIKSSGSIPEEGAFDPPDDKFSWKINAKRYSFNDSSGIDLIISWHEAGRIKDYTINSALSAK